ncbi:class I SAM-dependent methyltransferase [Chitinimonas naiadis]
MADFYDNLAPYYHLIYQDWPASVRRQGEQLSAVIESTWPGSACVLDVSCGIGTQAIALAEKGYSVIGSDLSGKAVERACLESVNWGVDIPFSVCNVREAHAHHGSGFDVVISADNSLPHLLNDRDLLHALRNMHDCLADGGGCLITVRDYAQEERGRNLHKPYGVRMEGNKRYLLSQVWDFEGEHYTLTFFVVEEDMATREVRTHAMRSRYYAVSTQRLCELMQEAGFLEVRRLDDAFYQPVLVGTKAM